MANIKNTKERRIFFAFTITIAIIFVVSYFQSSNKSVSHQSEVDIALSVLSNAKTLTLYSLEPKTDNPEINNPILNEKKKKNLPISLPKHYGTNLLGQTQVSGKEARLAAAEFRSVLGGNAIVMCACWEPRHAIRVVTQDHTYDYLLCYQCIEMKIYKDGHFLTSLKVRVNAGNPGILNQMLKEAGVKLPYIYSDEFLAIQEQKRQAVLDKKKPWVDAMPEIFQPHIKEVLEFEEYKFFAKNHDEIIKAPFHEALEKKLSNKSDRILALLEWHAFGDYWDISKTPEYQTLAYGLLLDFEPEEIFAALKDRQLTHLQKEGAIRLYLDMYINRILGMDVHVKHRRGLEKIQPELEEILYGHIVKFYDKSNSYKVRRVKEILGPYNRYDLTECRQRKTPYPDTRHREFSKDLNWVNSNKHFYFEVDRVIHRTSFSAPEIEILQDFSFISEVSPDRRYLLFWTLGKEGNKDLKYIYDTKKKQQILVFEGVSGDNLYEKFKFSPDSRKLAFVDFHNNKGSVTIIDLATYKQNVFEYPSPQNLLVDQLDGRTKLFWSEDGKSIYVGYVSKYNRKKFKTEEVYYRLNTNDKSFTKISGQSNSATGFPKSFIENGTEAKLYKGIWPWDNPTRKQERLESSSGSYVAEVKKRELYIKKNNESTLLEVGELDGNVNTISIIDWLEDNYLLYEFRGRIFIYGIKEKRKSEIAALRCVPLRNWLYDSGE